MAELADAPHSKCGGAIRAGSSPATGTRIFSPELTEFRAFLLPDSLYSGVLRVKCENRICRRNLAAIIKVGVNIRCRSDVAMSQPFLDVPKTDTVKSEHQLQNSKNFSQQYTKTNYLKHLRNILMKDH